MVNLGEEYARGVSTISEVDILEGLEVLSAKTLHIVVGGFTDDDGEVVVGVGE